MPDQAYRYTHTRLLVDDLQACLRFYRDVLDFPVALQAEDVYVEFDTGSVRLALYGRRMMSEVTGESGTAAGADRLALCITVDDVDAAYAKLTARGVPFVKAPHDRPVWALRVAHFRDPDGNLIEISQSIPMAAEG